MSIPQSPQKDERSKKMSKNYHSPSAVTVYLAETDIIATSVDLGFDQWEPLDKSTHI